MSGPARTRSGASAAREVAIRAVRRIGSAAAGAAGPEEESVLAGEPAVLGRDA